MRAKGSGRSDRRRVEDMRIFLKKERTDRSCPFMDVHGFCHCVHVVKCGKIVKEIRGRRRMQRQG